METTTRNFQPLVEQLADPEDWREAFAALEVAGADALPDVCNGLRHTNEDVRYRCAKFMDHHADDAAIGRLVLALYDPKRKVRWMATHALGCQRCKPAPLTVDVVPLLIEKAREDKSVKVRRMAMTGLLLQPPERRIARFFRRLLRDEADPKIRQRCERGLVEWEHHLRSRPATLSA